VAIHPASDPPSQDAPVRLRLPFALFIVVWIALLIGCWIHRGTPLSGRPLSGHWGLFLGFVVSGLQILSWKEGPWIVVRSTRRRVRQVAAVSGFFLLVLIAALLWTGRHTPSPASIAIQNP
jgi:hypothetical protein